jgi:hypothetical protein
MMSAQKIEPMAHFLWAFIRALVFVTWRRARVGPKRHGIRT